MENTVIQSVGLVLQTVFQKINFTHVSLLREANSVTHLHKTAPVQQYWSD